MNLESVNALITEKPDLNFGTIFSRSIELFKKVWVQGFIVLLLTAITIIPFYILVYIPMIAVGISDPDAMVANELPPMVAIAMVILMPVVMLGVATFSLALNAAFLKICRQKDQDVYEADDYFYFFKEGRLGKAFILAVYSLGLSILGVLACGVGLFYLLVPISLIPAFMAFNEDLNARDTLKACFKLGNKNWLVIFGLVFILSLVGQLGMFLCFIGILFTAMISKIPAYYIYKDGVGLEDKNEI